MKRLFHPLLVSRFCRFMLCVTDPDSQCSEFSGRIETLSIRLSAFICFFKIIHTCDPWIVVPNKMQGSSVKVINFMCLHNFVFFSGIIFSEHLIEGIMIIRMHNSNDYNKNSVQFQFLKNSINSRNV